MTTVSVVIPAYNQAEYLGAAIESVLQQRYADWELLVVNDASPDATSAVVKRYADPRIQLIEHATNRGLPAARNSGMRAASGSIIALLDADDYFHPDKLQAHVTFLAANPQVHVSYNARHEVRADGEILSLWRPATTATFTELVLGFPFSPSDMVLRREWAFRVDLFDERYVAMSEDLDINCRLALAGCHFGGIDQPLNYRRYYGNRAIRNVPARLQGAELALNRLFENPACPAEILALKTSAFANVYLVWSYEAFMAELTTLAQQWLQQAVALNPTLLAAAGAALHEFLIDRALQDGGDHVRAIRLVVEQLPRPLQWLATAIDQTIAQADARAAVREIAWGRTANGEALLKRVARAGIAIDQPLLRLVVDQLLTHRALLGADAADAMLDRLVRALQPVASRQQLRWLVGCYWLNRGFDSYAQQQYQRVPLQLCRAFWADPGNLRNRGAWSIGLRTLQPHRLLHSLRPKQSAIEAGY